MNNLTPPIYQDPAFMAQVRENARNKELQTDIMKCNTARQIASRLYEAVINYQKSLSNAQDVALQIVHFNTNTIIVVENIGYIDYSLVVFRGKDNNGRPIELIQHISQINVLMTAIPSQPQEPEIYHRTIGFQVN